jgi:hypothetical protein
LRAFLNIFMRDIFSSPRFDYPNNILWSVQVIKLLIMQFSPASCHFFLLGPNILLSTLFSNTPCLYDIWGLHSGEDSSRGLLGCDAV